MDCPAEEKRTNPSQAYDNAVPELYIANGGAAIHQGSTIMGFPTSSETLWEANVLGKTVPSPYPGAEYSGYAVSPTTTYNHYASHGEVPDDRLNQFYTKLCVDGCTTFGTNVLNWCTLTGATCANPSGKSSTSS